MFLQFTLLTHSYHVTYTVNMKPHLKASINILFVAYTFVIRASTRVYKLKNIK